MNRAEFRQERNGRAALSLLLVYLLVLQGVFAGIASAAPNTGPLADAICLSKPSVPFDGSPGVPARHVRHDGCCAFHAAGAGGGSAEPSFADEAPVFSSSAAPRRAYDLSQLRASAATPPIGSRAPPRMA